MSLASTTAEPLDQVLGPGGLSFLFQPILELRRDGPALHGVECFARGPAGTPLEQADQLFELVRARGAEARVDRAFVEGALEAAPLLPGRFTINVHAVTLQRDLGFVPWLLSRLESQGLSPRRLTLDLVAPQLARCTRTFLQGLAQLRAAGIAIAVDDVGLYTADFHCILSCQPDYVKLDRYLIHRSTVDPVAAAMIDSLIRLTRTVGGQAVAEGVETRAELESVAAQGLCLLQGYLFCAPLALEPLLRSELFASDGSFMPPLVTAA